MAEKPIEKMNEESHALIDHLTERKMSGEVTFYFNDGLIESCRVSERHTKTEIKAKAEERKKNRSTALTYKRKQQVITGPK